MNTEEIAKAVTSATNIAPASSGWEKVVWANKLTATACKVSYGFNFQPKGKFQVGEIVVDAWGGIKDQSAGNVCQVLAIV